METPNLLVDGDVGGEVPGDGLDLARGVAEVLVPLVAELPVLRLVVLHAPACGVHFVFSSEQSRCLIGASQEVHHGLITSARGRGRTSCSRQNFTTKW